MTKYFSMLFLITAAGCASVTTGTTQPISVDTPHADGASCTLKDSADGNWSILSTPGQATVEKGSGPMTIECQKAGFHKGMTVLQEEFQGATAGNILLGGGVGIIVDAATGADQAYPESAKVFLEPVSWPSQAAKEQWAREKSDYEAQLAEEAAKKKQVSEDYPSKRR